MDSGFEVSGNLGADGSGSATGNVAPLIAHSPDYGLTIYGYYKLVNGAGFYDASVNHLIISASRGVNEWSTDTNNDSHTVRFDRNVNVVFYRAPRLLTPTLNVRTRNPKPLSRPCDLRTVA